VLGNADPLSIYNSIYSINIDEYKFLLSEQNWWQTVMRHLKILLLKHDGNTEWRIIPWGKSHLDYHRKDGYILMSFEL
jgi:hypothetical protein